MDFCLDLRVVGANVFGNPDLLTTHVGWRALLEISDVKPRSPQMAQRRQDREFVLNAVSTNGSALRWASDDLKGDREIVLNAVSKNGCALRWASDDLKGDREIVLKAVSKYGCALRWASDHLKGDREIVLNAVSKDYHALRLAAEDLKGDREIVLSAVSESWYALKYASSELCEDEEIQELILGQPRFERTGLLLKVSLLSGRSCTVLAQMQDGMDSVMERCSVNLGLERQHVVDNGKLVRQGAKEATGMIGSLYELQTGRMHLMTLVL